MPDILQAIKRALLFISVMMAMLPGWASGWTREGRHVVTQSPARGPTQAPLFDMTTPTVVNVTATKTAILSCLVHNLGNNSVSWIRNRDLHILSVGSVTYTTDSRFQVVPPEGSGDWLLRIRYAHPRDSGQYDCQVSSRPPTARTVYLTVVEPRAKILLSPEMHVGLGSLINLTCIVPYAPEPPDYLYWYHKEKMVRKDGGRVFIHTHLGTRSVSQLVVKHARAEDSGVYTCSPAHSREDNITIHVLTGEYPAAMQRGSSFYASRSPWRSIGLCLSVIFSTSFSCINQMQTSDGGGGKGILSCISVLILTMLHCIYM